MNKKKAVEAAFLKLFLYVKKHYKFDSYPAILTGCSYVSHVSQKQTLNS